MSPADGECRLNSAMIAVGRASSSAEGSARCVRRAARRQCRARLHARHRRAGSSGGVCRPSRVGGIPRSHGLRSGRRPATILCRTSPALSSISLAAPSERRRSPAWARSAHSRRPVAGAHVQSSRRVEHGRAAAAFSSTSRAPHRGVGRESTARTVAALSSTLPARAASVGDSARPKSRGEIVSGCSCASRALPALAWRRRW